MSAIWPTELKVQNHGRMLVVSFDNGSHYELSAEFLRVESPSAEVKGHGPGQEQLVFGKRNVAITSIEPIGTYAARLVFSDGHNSGLFTWVYLAELGHNHEKLWQAYEEKLLAAHLKR